MVRSMTRRRFIGATAAATTFAMTAHAENKTVLGQGEFKYRVVPGWGALGGKTPVKNCHGIVTDREGYVILLTDETKNNVIVYDKKGKLVYKWGHAFPGAHGLSIVTEGDKQFLFLTDLKRGMFFKTTLDGKLLGEWGWPQDSGKYKNQRQYHPSWTLHRANGEFFVLDGYGRDYITHHAPDGKRLNIFGGREGGIVHWGPHGGMMDERDPKNPTLLIAMSDQQYLIRLGLKGGKLAQIDLPGGNPRQIRHRKGHFFVAHLADNWPKNRNSRGFVSVLDKDLTVVSNIAGTPPAYDDNGKLQKMASAEPIFIHPHDLTVDDEGSIYVAQFASRRTYPIKLERV